MEHSCPIAITGLSNVDRISGLPNNLLCHILAFLLTRSAVATCVLAERWKYVWTGIPVLDFTDPPNSTTKSSYTLSGKQYISFKNFMNRFLLLNGTSCLERVDLVVYDTFNSKDLYEWFTVMGRRWIKEFNLFCKVLVETCLRPIKLPMMSLFSGLAREQIVVLRLSCDFRLSLHVPMHSTLELPCLEVLHCKEVIFKTYDADDPVGYLLSGCPSLREVVVADCSGMRKLSICCSALKILEVSFKRTGITAILKVPNLEYLKLDDDWTVYEIDDLPSLVEAKISINVIRFTKCMELLQRLWHARSLLLQGNILDTYYYGYQQPLFFENLNCLELSCFQWPTILEVARMLKYMPNLASLIINKHMLVVEDDEWCWPNFVPECLGLPLEYIEFHDFMGGLDLSIKMVRCFLTHCMALKEMKFKLSSQLSLENKYEVLKKLLKLPRPSNCEITIC